MYSLAWTVSFPIISKLKFQPTSWGTSEGRRSKHCLVYIQCNCCFKWSHQHIFEFTVISFIDHNSKCTSSAPPLEGRYTTGTDSIEVPSPQENHVQSQGADRHTSLRGRDRGREREQWERYCCPQIALLECINKRNRSIDLLEMSGSHLWLLNAKLRVKLCWCTG